MSDQAEGGEERTVLDLTQNVRGGPLHTLVTSAKSEESGVAAVRLVLVHAAGHDDHLLEAKLARVTGEQLVAMADAVEEANRARIETYGPEDLRDLGPPGNGKRP